MIIKKELLKDKEYSFVDIEKKYINNELFELIHCFYQEKENGSWIRKSDIFENKDYYFYVKKDEADNKKIPGLIYENKIYETVDGNQCIKVIPTKKLNTKEFKEIRSNFEHTYESDVPALTRWIGKSKPRYGKDIRKLYIDIEALKDLEGNYSTPEKPSGKISMIGCYDNFLKKYFIFCFKLPSIELIDKLKKNNIEVIFCSSEVAMIKEFISFVKKNIPDYILGWNIESYDMPYILARMEFLKIDKNELSPLNSCWMKQQEEISAHKFSSFTVVVRGIGIFDLMSASQRLWLGKYCGGYSLNSMSKEYLKEEKLKILDLDKVYEKDFDRYLEYNIKDIELSLKLDEKLNLFKNFQSFQEIISINVQDSLVQSRNIVQYFLQNTDRILLNGDKGIKTSGYKGAVVLDTIPGIYENCYKYDFVSMYPSFVITYNMSPDTILPDFVPGCISMDGKYFFKNDKEGIVTRVMKELYDRRIEYKKAKNEHLSLAYKLMTNSIYGQFAASYSRIFSFPCAEAITYQGRRLLDLLCKKIHDNYKGHVVMGDTDSICFHPSESFDPDSLLRVADSMFEEIYKKDNVNKNKLLKLEMEKKIDKMIIFGSSKGSIKKKYIEIMKQKVTENGIEKEILKKKVTGLDSIKSDTVLAAKDMQNALVEYFANNDSTYRGTDEIVNKYKSMFLEKVKEKDYMYFAIPAKLNKPLDKYGGLDKNGREKAKTFSISALENSNLRVSINERFYIIVGKKGRNEEFPYAFKDPTDIPKDFCLDSNRMWERIASKADIFYYLVTPPQKRLLDFFSSS